MEKIKLINKSNDKRKFVEIKIILLDNNRQYTLLRRNNINDNEIYLMLKNLIKQYEKKWKR